MKSFIYIILIFAFLISARSEYLFVNESGFISKKNPVLINGIAYIDAEAFQKMILKNYSFNKRLNTFFNKRERIYILPGSIYVLYETGKCRRMAQMSLPVLEHNGKIILPFLEFINSLKVVSLLDYSISGNIISYSNPDFIPDTCYPEYKKTLYKEGPDIKTIKTDDEIKDNIIVRDKDHSYLKEAARKIISGFGNHKFEFRTEDISNGVAGEMSMKSDTTLSESIPEINEKNIIDTIDNNNMIPVPSYPPSVYVLPEKLVRREIDAILNKSKK